MSRIVDPSQGVDPALAEVLSGAPRERKNIREDDSRSRRANKKGRDKFYVPPELIPNGWVVEWKRASCLGKPEEADYGMDLSDAGWKPASMEHFKTLMPADYTGKTIERGGQVLMTRPKHMRDADRKLDYEEAVNQVKDKLSEIGMTGQGELKRVVTGFNRGYERSGRMIPEDDGSDAEVE